MLSAFQSASNYIWGEDESGGNQQQNEEEVKNVSEPQTEEVHRDDRIVVRTFGELWKFNSKREEFKLVLREIEILILEDESNEFESSLILAKKNGEVLIRERVCNELNIQYNKKEHSMVFTIYNESKDRIDILAFIFQSGRSEHDFKLAMAMKLFENNRQESFEKLLKKKQVKEEDRDWVGESLEVSAFGDVEYEELDDQELDEDVVMRDCTAMYEEEEENVLEDEEDNKQNKWEQAAFSSPAQFEQSEELSALQGRNREHENKHITGSKSFNRTYVVRENPRKTVLGFFRHNDSNELEYQGKLPVCDLQGKRFTPQKVLQHKSDRQMLFLSDDKPGTISVMNLDRGKVVEEWEAKEDGYGDVRDIAPLTKHEQMTDNPMVYGITHNSMFSVDGRVNTKNKCVESKQYASKVGFSKMATSGQGYIAAGADDGAIRMYDRLGKRAKTLLPGLGDSVYDIEVSNDGKWILATCDNYIMVIPTVVPGTERTGFEGRGMGKQKPRPYILRIRNRDMQRFNLRYVQFTPARFDSSKDDEEHWIVSSTGPYIVKWNFRKLKKAGIVNDYSIRRASNKVVHSEFRFNHGDDLLVSETDNVYAQHSHKRKKG